MVYFPEGTNLNKLLAATKLDIPTVCLKRFHHYRFLKRMHVRHVSCEVIWILLVLFRPLRTLELVNMLLGKAHSRFSFPGNLEHEHPSSTRASFHFWEFPILLQEPCTSDTYKTLLNVLVTAPYNLYYAPSPGAANLG